MRRYAKGDQVEVLNMKGTLEDLWHPAQITGGYGNVYSVLYDGHANGVEREMVLAKCIRPKPPVVVFADWSRGDLVHVFNNFAWKLATVLQVLEKKQFLVRVVGSRKDLSVSAAWIRVRHYWQDDQWTIIGKGPSKSDVRRPLTRLNMISDPQVQPKNINHQPFTLGNQQGTKRRNRQNSYNAPSMVLKRNAPWTHNQAEAYGRPGKVSRTFESGLMRNQTEACTGTATRSRLTEDYLSSCRPPATNATVIEIQDDDSVISSVGCCCSVNNDCSSHPYLTKLTQHHNEDDLSDAESSTGSTCKQRTLTGMYVMEKGQEMVVDRPAQRCSLVLRFRLQDPSLREVAL